MDRIKKIGELAIRHHLIRQRIEKLRNRPGPCTEKETFSFSSVNDFFSTDGPYSNPRGPCFNDYHAYKNETSDSNYLVFDDMCPNCQERERTRKTVNEISLQGAAIKRRMTWQVKHAIKENEDSDNPTMYITTDELFELIT